MPHAYINAGKDDTPAHLVGLLTRPSKLGRSPATAWRDEARTGPCAAQRPGAIRQSTARRRKSANFGDYAEGRVTGDAC